MKNNDQKNIKRNSPATLALKQKTVSIYYKDGIKKAMEFSNYSDKTIYTWIKQQEKGTLAESKVGRVPYTKTKLLKEIESDDFLDNIDDEDKDFVIKLMREILL